MTLLPQRQLLTTQTAAYLADEIRSGKWGEWLPSERVLAQELQVSRNTLRAALGHLRHEGLVEAMHGAGNRIVAGPAKVERPVSHDVAFLTPEPLERLRPTVTLWIDELRGLLSERGCRIRIFHGSGYFRANPGGALKKLVDQNPHGCWVLVLSNEGMQRWFSRGGKPCVVGGTCYAGVDLPYVDLDHRATCRHAAGVLLGLGHRRIALLHQRPYRAGDLEGAEGFLSGMRSSPRPGVEPQIVSHDPSVEEICRTLRRLMEQKRHPTALLVLNPYYYLTIASCLTNRGWNIPRDVSVLSRDEDPFLSFVVPTPSRYAVTTHTFARHMLRAVLAILNGGEETRAAVRIMPDFIRGESIGPPPS